MKNKGLLRLLDILIVIAAVALAILVIILIDAIRDVDFDGYSTSSLQYAVEDAQYDRLVDMTMENRHMGRGIGKAQYEDYYAAADYYVAAFYEKMYAEDGNEVRASFWADKKRDAESRLGLLTYEKTKIDNIFR